MCVYSYSRISFIGLPGMESKSMYILYCLYSQFGVRGNLTDIICTAVNKITSGQAIEAQKYVQYGL